jgi:hypothetical protein
MVAFRFNDECCMKCSRRLGQARVDVGKIPVRVGLVVKIDEVRSRRKLQVVVEIDVPHYRIDAGHRGYGWIIEAGGRIDDRYDARVDGGDASVIATERHALILPERPQKGRRDAIVRFDIQLPGIEHHLRHAKNFAQLLRRRRSAQWGLHGANPTCIRFNREACSSRSQNGCSSCLTAWAIH